MARINLWIFYPWVRKDEYVDITNEILEAMKTPDCQEAAYKQGTVFTGCWRRNRE